MRGQEQIIAARMAGKKPSIVFLNDYPCKTDWFETGEHVTVCTDGDLMTSMDFRFLIGLRVSISALTEQRAKAIFERVKQAGAGVVAACHVQEHQHPLDAAGWSFVYHKELVNG
jgi:ATP-dependent Clp protease adapter protein ClpS